MRRTPSPESVVTICAACPLLVACALLLLVRESYGRVGDVQTITINGWHGRLCTAILASCVVLAGSAIWARRRRRPWASWLLLVLGIVSPLACCEGVFNEAMGFHDGGSVRDRDGREYHLLENAFLQGSELDLVRLRRRMGPLEEYEVLVRSPWEESLGFLAVARPERFMAGDLYLTEDRVLVGVPYGNMAFLAYDLKRGKPYSQVYNDDEHGYTDMRELSPFLLLGAADVPRESDFRTLLDPASYGRPYPRAVGKDSYSPNPRARELAKKLLADLRAHPAPK